MQGFIFKKVFANQFYNQSDSVVLRKTTVELPDSPSAVAQAGTQPHTSPEKQLTPENIPNPNTSYVTTP
jgi:hypothetical protein